MLALNGPKELLTGIVDIAHQAGQAVLEVYRTPFDVAFKEDSSPVTRADQISHDLICSALKDLTPHIPIVSEESGGGEIATGHFWLVDPLDGTKEFIHRNDEFTVNIALIDNNIPLLGVVYAPALDLLYGGIVGDNAFKIGPDGQIPISAQQTVGTEVVVVCSRSHSDLGEIEGFLSSFGGERVIHPVGSSLKFCKIADGAAHLYPRLGRTMEWDTAAGQAILMAAGGCIITFSGDILTYGKKNFENPSFMAFPSVGFLIDLAADKQGYGGGCPFLNVFN